MPLTCYSFSAPSLGVCVCVCVCSTIFSDDTTMGSEFSSSFTETTEENTVQKGV